MRGDRGSAFGGFGTMTALERRLARMEARAGIGTAWPVIFVGFVNPDGTHPPIASVTVRDRVWRREPGEAGEAFRERVGAEARLVQPNDVIVGFLSQAPGLPCPVGSAP